MHENNDVKQSLMREIFRGQSSLREGLSLNFEVDYLTFLIAVTCIGGTAFLGRLEYQRGNAEGALRVFDGIDLQAATQRLQATVSEKQTSKKAHKDVASLVLEAIYLKAKSLQKLGRLNDAATECKSVLDAVEKIFCQDIPDVQLLPSSNYLVAIEAIHAYRRALLSQWNLDNDSCARIQKAFAVFLLHSGVEASPPSLAAQIDGSYVPKHNLEEAILLLMILNRKFCLGKIKWDPSIMEHLTFALSLCSQTFVLAKQLEEIKPGVLHRVDRQNKAALNLLQKSLHKHEAPGDLVALLLAAKICSEDSHLAAEGVGYARRAIRIAESTDAHLKGVAIRMLGLCLGKQAKISSSDFERSSLQSQVLKSLDDAIAFEKNNPDLIFELGEWRFLTLVLSAQQRFSESEVINDAALDETAKWEQGPLLRLKAKLKPQHRNTHAIENYRHLLALVQAQRKSFTPSKSITQAEDDKVNEFEVWHGLADLYSRLSHWKDVEVCLGKARELKHEPLSFTYQLFVAIFSVLPGVMCQGRGQAQEALYAHINSFLLDTSYVPCKILMGALLSKMGANALPVARSILSDALRLEPTNRMAWYYLGMVHRDDGRISDATDCFQAASMLQESDPIECFSSIL
ncbi:hypothetical protein K2173_019449 [Erythroxylum novogranatense]|uniref:Uncharacterized protein n=1 Tax=Erythroxylum novogranatense TaxID=1862640 RepID=A0AAV8UBA1_9ROSI|nr:hypothetical protein K2173_019449 [Erythroxylum novogranatense]